MVKPIEIASAEEFVGRYDPENKLRLYFSLLREENEKVNLVSRETIDGGLISLVAESLMPFEVLGQQKVACYLDIGSGGGIPAIPILLTQQIESATLIERTQKKAAALNRMLIALGLHAEVLPGTYEQLSLKSEFDLITMRLVRLEKAILHNIIGILKPGGHFVHYSAVDQSLVGSEFELTTYCYSIDSVKKSNDFSVLKKK